MQSGDGTHLKALAQGIDAQVEQHLPRLLLGPELLPDPVETLVEVDPQAGQNLLLRDINRLGVTFPTPERRA